MVPSSNKQQNGDIQREFGRLPRIYSYGGSTSSIHKWGEGENAHVHLLK